MNESVYEVLGADIRTAARMVAREWPGSITEDDAEQEIWSNILESGDNTIWHLTEMETANRVSTLSLYGHRIAARYRDDYELFSGNFRYSTDEVRKLLDEDALVAEDGKPDSLTTTVRIDLTMAMDRLRAKNQRHAELIERKYLFGEQFDRESPERYAVNRAVDSLSLEMNRVHRTRIVEYTDGPGSRTAVSNEQAMRLTRNDYRGGS